MAEAKKTNPEKILVIEDDDNAREFICHLLNTEGYITRDTHSGSQAIRWLQEWQPHLVVSDVNMPEMSGLELLQAIRRQISYVSVIFVSANINSDDVIKGLSAGADDYICKPFDNREFLARVKNQFRVKEVNDQLREANLKLKELVDIDDLTGLYNMRSLYQRLEHELERGRRFNRSVCVVMMDMDYFKNVNDAHDHLFGSFVLSELGKIIRNNIRTVDFAARYGGDEFLIVLTEVNTAGAKLFCDRLRTSIKEYTFDNGEDSMKLTASLGFAITEGGNITSDARGLVKLADRALYEAKSAGRDCIRYCDLSEKESFLSVPEGLKRQSAIKVR